MYMEEEEEEHHHQCWPGYQMPISFLVLFFYEEILVV